MRMQDRPGSAYPYDGEVETRFSRGLARPGQDLAVLVDLHDVTDRHCALVHPAGCDGQTQRSAAHGGTEITAGAEHPPARVKLGPDLGEGGGQLGEAHSSTIQPPGARCRVKD